MESEYYPYDMGTSEYKMKFKEWAIPEPTDSATVRCTINNRAL